MQCLPQLADFTARFDSILTLRDVDLHALEHLLRVGARLGDTIRIFAMEGVDESLCAEGAVHAR